MTTGGRPLPGPCGARAEPPLPQPAVATAATPRAAPAGARRDLDGGGLARPPVGAAGPPRGAGGEGGGFAGGNRPRLERVEVEAGVSVVGAGRHARVRRQAPDREPHGRPFTANRSKRAAAVAGSRAVTCTPSAVSSRSSSAARSCSSARRPPSP